MCARRCEVGSFLASAAGGEGTVAGRRESVSPRVSASICSDMASILARYISFCVLSSYRSGALRMERYHQLGELVLVLSGMSIHVVNHFPLRRGQSRLRGSFVLRILRLHLVEGLGQLFDPQF